MDVESCRMDTSEAAQYLGLSPRTLMNKRNLKIGPSYIKIGGRVVYDRTDLDEYLQQHKVNPER